MSTRARARARPPKPARRLDGATWIAAAHDAIAEGGMHALRVEPLAAALGVTKGSFYWHFADRRALVDAVLDHWREGRIAAIRQQTQSADPPSVVLRRLAELYTQAANYHGLAIEIAVRGFARTDAPAAAAVRRVDAERLARVTALFRALGWSEAEAKARAVLFYAYLFGRPLLHPAAATRALRTDAVAALIAAPGTFAKAANASPRDARAR